jgi:hypothetical protein
MAPNSKPPSSHQTRPPLTSRIRASFESKRSKSVNKGHVRSNSQSEEVASPTAESHGSPITNGFLSSPTGHDADTLRSAIDQAINSDAFQGAIAAHLAKLIKPSIKSALDTIQPLVEAVYTHELLLRKTNQNVDALERMETNVSKRGSRVDLSDGDAAVAAWTEQPHPIEVPVAREVMASGSSPDHDHLRQLLEEHTVKHANTLAELSTSIRSTDTRTAEMADAVVGIKASLGSVEALKITSEESSTTISVLQAQLDQLKDDVGQILQAIGSDLGKNVQAIHERGVPEPPTSLFSEHTTKLDNISTDILALRSHGDTAEKIDVISTELAALKESVENGVASNTEGFTSLGAQITSALSALEGHTAILAEINEKPAHPDLIAAVQQSNDSHALHTAALGELKERSLGTSPAVPAAEGGANSETTAALSDLKQDLASLKENIESGLTSHGENVAGLGAKIDTVLSTIEEHQASDPSADILAAVQQSNEHHAGHAAALENIKSAEHGSPDVSGLETQITDMISTLQAHSTALDEIKVASGTHTAALESHGAALEGLKSIHPDSTPVPSDDSIGLEPHLTSIASTLEEHSAILENLKIASGSHTAALESHGAALEGLKSINPDAVAAPSDDNALEPHLNSIASTLEEHSAILEDLKTASGSHTVALETHGAALEGLKSINPDSTPVPSDDHTSLEPHFTSITSTLEEHSAILEELKTAIGSHTVALETHGTALDGIKSLSGDSEPVSSPVDLAPLEAHVDAIISTLEAHSAILDEVRSTGASHITALESHGVALDNIKSIGNSDGPASEGENLANLEAQVNAIAETLQTHTAALEELKGTASSHADALAERSIDGPPSGEGGNLAELEDKIGYLATTLQTHGTILDEIRSSSDSHGALLDEIKTAHFTHASALDEIKTTTLQHGSLLEEIRSPVLLPTAPMGGLPDPSNLATLEIQIGSIVNTLSTHTSALADIGTRVGASNASLLNPSEDDSPPHDLNTVIEILDAHTAMLNEIKEDVAAEILTGLHNVDQKQENISNLLFEIRESDVSEEVLTLLHGIGESTSSHTTGLESIKEAIHTSHGALEEIKSRDIAPPETAVSAQVDLSNIEAQIVSMHAVLEDHKASLSSIKDATTASHDMHLAHGSSLEEIKSRSLESAPGPAVEIPSLEGLEAKLDTVIASLDEHRSTLSAIKDTTSASQDFHTSHSEALEELKSRSVEPLAVPAVEMPNFEVVEGKIDSLISSLDEHKAALSEIKDTTTASHEMHALHTASLDEIKSKSFEAVPAPTVEAPDFSGLETQLSHIVANLEEHKSMLSEMQEYHGSHSASLDEIKSRSVDQVPVADTPDFSGLETQLGGIVTTLEEHKAMLSSMQELHGAHEASLDEIKMRSAEAPDFSGLEAQIAGVVTSLEEHKTMLSTIQESAETHNASINEVKSKSIDPDHINGIITSLEDHKTSLAAIQEKTTASHDLHVAHAASLDEKKSRSIDSTPDSQPSINIEGLETQIGGIISTLEEQKVTLSELKDATSNFVQSHAAQTTLLNEIRDGTAQSNESHSSHATMLTELKATEPGSPDLSAIEAHLNAIITTLESQTEKLSSLKDNTATSDVHEAIKQSHDLLTTNHELLSSHTNLLDSIIESTSHPHEETTSSLTELKSLLLESKSGIDNHGELVRNLHSSTTESQSSLTTAIAALAVGGAAGAGATALLSHEDDSSSEVLAEVKAVRALVESSKEDIQSMRSQLDINHTTVTTTLTSLGDEIKAEIDASSTHLNDSVIAMHDDVKAIDIGSVHQKLDKQGTDFKELNNSLTAVHGDVKAIDVTSLHQKIDQHGTEVRGLASHFDDAQPIDLAPLHAALELHGAGIDGIYTQLEGLDGSLQTLHEGVHLNDTGLGQLQLRSVTRQVSNSAIDEGMWFGRDKSVSPVVGRNDSLEPGERSLIPAVLAGVMAGGTVTGAATLLSHDKEKAVPTIESGHQEDEGAAGSEAEDSEDIVEDNEAPILEPIEEVQEPDDADIDASEDPQETIPEGDLVDNAQPEPGLVNHAEDAMSQPDPEIESHQKVVESEVSLEEPVDEIDEVGADEVDEAPREIVSDEEHTKDVQSESDDPNDEPTSPQPQAEELPEDITEESEHPVEKEHEGDIEEPADLEESDEAVSESANDTQIILEATSDRKIVDLVEGEANDESAVKDEPEVLSKDVTPRLEALESHAAVERSVEHSELNQYGEEDDEETTVEVDPRATEEQHDDGESTAMVESRLETSHTEKAEYELEQASGDSSDELADPTQVEDEPKEDHIVVLDDYAIAGETHATPALSENPIPYHQDTTDSEESQDLEHVEKEEIEDQEAASHGSVLDDKVVEDEVPYSDVAPTEQESEGSDDGATDEHSYGSRHDKKLAGDETTEEPVTDKAIQMAELPEDLESTAKSGILGAHFEEEFDDNSSVDDVGTQYEETLPTTSDHTALPSEASELGQGQDHEEEDSTGNEKQYSDSEDEKPEGALSPIMESPADDGNIVTVADKFSDEQASESFPSQPQVQPLSYQSTFSSSPMSQSHEVEQELRETAYSQLGTPRGVGSFGFDTEGPLSSPFIEQPQGLEFDLAEHTDTQSQAQITPTYPNFASTLSQPPFTQEHLSYQESSPISTSHSSRAHDHKMDDYDSQPVSPVSEDENPQMIQQNSINIASYEIDSIRQNQQPLSRISTTSSVSALGSPPPRATSPLEQVLPEESSSQYMRGFETQTKDMNSDSDALLLRTTQTLSSDEQPPFNPDLIIRPTGSNSRRTTIESQHHSIPSSAPGAEYYAPSATESHYSASEVPDVGIEADSFAPVYDNYSPGDIVNHYADYTPSAYGQTPAGPERAAYFDSTRAAGQRNLDSDEDVETPPIPSELAQYSTDVPMVTDHRYSEQTFTPPHELPTSIRELEYSGESSPIDQQYMQRESYEPDLDIEPQGHMAQYAMYSQERSPTEPSPYSQQGLLDREYDAPPLPTHRSQYTGDNSTLGLDERLAGRYADPERRYISEDDEQYMQGHQRTRRQALEQQYSSSASYESQSEEEADEEDENGDEPPNTGHFQQQFGSANLLAVSVSRENIDEQDMGTTAGRNPFTTIPPNIAAQARRVDYEDDFVSPRSTDRFLDEGEDEDAYESRLNFEEYTDHNPSTGLGGFEHVGDAPSRFSTMREQYPDTENQAPPESPDRYQMDNYHNSEHRNLR